jgi:hypothetical protein
VLIITGTQRSGTSVVAKMFLREGYDLGTTWWDDSVNGGLENPAACEAFSEALGEPDFPFRGFNFSTRIPTGWAWWEFRELHKTHRVIKFSYLCMNPAFVSIWNKLRPPMFDDRFLILDRPKRDVYMSKAAHSEVFKWDCTLLKQTTRVLLANYYHSVTLLKEKGYRFAKLPFKDLLSGVGPLNSGVRSLGLHYQISEEVWESVIDLNKVHFGGENAAT